MLNPSAVESLRRVFHQNFSVHDIAEPLVSCEGDAAAEEVRRFMEQRKFEVVGLREEGLVVGYVERSDLQAGVCRDFLRRFGEGEVVFDSTTLADVIRGLRDSPRLFVSVFGRVGGIVTKSDLQKPPVRMWLFGIITLIEMRVTRMIEECYPHEEWKQFLTAGRLEKAEDLLAERMRLNQHLHLLDCLQFADKGHILAKSQQLRSMTRFESNKQLKATIKRLERLRDNLAHSQDIITTNWESVVNLAENLDNVLEGPPGLGEVDA